MEPGFARIRALRVGQGMSQRQLARRAKINRSTVRRIEKGTCRASIDVYQRLLHPLGMWSRCTRQRPRWSGSVHGHRGKRI